MRLTRPQEEGFARDGFLVVERVFTEAEVAALRVEADAVLAFLINSSTANRRRSGRLELRELPDGTQLVRKIQPFVDLSPVFTRLMHDERVRGPVAQLMGDEPEVMEDKLVYKQRLRAPVRELPALQADDRFLVHNDWMYHRADGYSPRILNAAVCIERCGPTTGPLHVWPGTHTAHIEHELIGSSYQVPASDLDHDGGIDLVVEAGTLILFHCLLVHSSRPNRSGAPRPVAIFSYHPRAEGIPFDVRNGPTRRRERRYERRYVRLKAAAKVHDGFPAPCL